MSSYCSPVTVGRAGQQAQREQNEVKREEAHQRGRLLAAFFFVVAFGLSELT